MSKNVLVTGGCGFIGSHLCDFLHSEGNSVFCLDNGVTGNWDNVAHLVGRERFQVLEADVVELKEFSLPLDEVYHMASPASPLDFERLSVEIMEANANGTQNLLGICKEKAAKFLFASTSEVYGDPKEHPQSETYWGNVNPVGPRSPYDVSKRFGEAYVTAFCRRHKLPYSIIRIFNTYGPRMPDDGRVMRSFLQQALNQKDITVMGDGHQSRSFTYVSDLVEGLVKAMAVCKPEPINMGSTDEISILKLAEHIIEITGSKSKITRIAAAEDDPKTRKPDISKAITDLQWQPKVSLEEGIKKSLEFLRQKVT